VVEPEEQPAEQPAEEGAREATILLASASPRRHRLLGEAGVTFQIEVSSADETLSGGSSPESAAEILAERKARAVAERHHGESLLVIGADTLVAVDDPDAASGVRFLGKPSGPDQAREMLRSLSGTRHRVVTGVAVVRAWDGAGLVGHERTWVSMRTITADEIGAYVDSGEWRDKAGGYAIQETADVFVTGLEGGGLDNVVGLPVALTLGLLERARGSQ